MTVYYKDPIYTVSHIAFGFAAAYIPSIVLAWFIIWQIGQLALNVRVFICTLTYERGNSRQHTAKKFAEFIIGFALGIAARYLLGIGRNFTLSDLLK
jgi:hypothetical protein